MKFFFISICFTLSFPLYAEEIKAKFFKIVEHTITTDEIYLHGKKVCRDMNARNASGELAEAIKNDEFMYFDSSVCYLKRIPKGTSATELKQALRQCQESKNSAEVNNGSRSIISHAKDVEKVIKKKNSQKPKANRE